MIVFIMHVLFLFPSKPSKVSLQRLSVAWKASKASRLPLAEPAKIPMVRAEVRAEWRPHLMPSHALRRSPAAIESPAGVPGVCLHARMVCA